MIVDLLNNSSEILLYFVPGYIFLRLKNTHYVTETVVDLDKIILSVLYSFLIVQVSNFMFGSLLNFSEITNMSNKIIEYISRDDLRALVIIVLVYPLFIVYLTCIFFKNRILSYMRKEKPDSTTLKDFLMIGRRHRRQAPTVWKHFFDSVGKDDFIRVRLKDSDFVYIGKLLNYSLKSDNNLREISLRQYDILYLSTEACFKKYEELESFFEDDRTVLYLSNDNIKSIECINYNN